MGLLERIYESVLAEEGGKRAERRRKAEEAADRALGPPPPPPTAPVDPLAGLDEHLKQVEAAELEAQREARRAYLTLLVGTLPPRVDPAMAPSLDAHALAAPSASGPVPTPADTLRILRAADKTPDALRTDLRLLTRIRNHADLAAQLAQRQAAEREADGAVCALEAEYEQVRLDWETKIAIQKRLAREALSRRYASDHAARELTKVQGIDFEVTQVLSPMIRDRNRATPEELAAEQTSRDARAALETKAMRLAGLERVFFPAPPPPERDPNVTSYEGYTYEYHPRSEP